MVRKIALLIVLISTLLTGCQQATVQVTQPTRLPTGVLTPYQSPTATPARPTPTIIVTIVVTPSPTPTPVLHTIANDDTLLGLAFRYGVSLEALKTANPSVYPNAMTVGSQLVIPINTASPEVQPTPTALPVSAGQPRCTLTGDGGAWCIVSVQNDLETNLENLSVWIGLYDSQGENFTSQVAYAPLDILSTGSSMPLMAHFAPPLPAEFSARAELVSASSVALNDSRYVNAEVKKGSQQISPDGSQAEVIGDVILPDGTPAPSQVWVLAVAYDANGNIIGMRKWKSASETHFDITVYSVGESIDHVELLTEVSP